MKSFRLLSNIKMASLFTGIGGLDTGFIELGAQLIFACDTDAAARETYFENFGHRVSNRLIETINPVELKGVDLIVAGPPCQGFSSLGLRDNNDERNDLILASARLIATSRPKAFVIENVTGITWLANGKYLSEVLGILRKADLVADSIIIKCDELGLPQRRRRVLIVGGNPRVGTNFIEKIRALSDYNFSSVSVRQALVLTPGLNSSSNHEIELPRTEWHKKVINAIGPSQKLCDTRLADSSVHSWDLPEIFGDTTPEEKRLLLAVSRLRRSALLRPGEHIGDGRPIQMSVLASSLDCPMQAVRKHTERLCKLGYLKMDNKGLIDLARKFNGRFKRLPLDGPSPAVVREFAFARNVLHPLEHRALTVRECARLQGFQDDFRIIGNKAQQFKQVANAFPPPISRILALQLFESISTQFKPNSARIPLLSRHDRLLKAVSQ